MTVGAINSSNGIAGPDGASQAISPYISFCTTCYNRGDQLRRVFDENASRIQSDAACQWVIVDFGSNDGSVEFVRERLDRQSNRIFHVRERSGRPWHLSYAKNVAHRLAQGEVLVSLDCDNFIGNAVDVVRRYFTMGASAVHMWSGLHGDGTSGRIAVRRKLFHHLGGYDEAFLPMGYQDLDFISRITANGAVVLRAPCAPDSALRNTKIESMKHCQSVGFSWSQCDALNRERSALNLQQGRLIANCGKWAPLDTDTMRGALPDTAS